MKHTLLFCAALCSYVFPYAQKPTSPSDQNKLTVTLSKDSMFVTYKSQPVPIRSIQALDSLMKKIPNPEQLKVEFVSQGADPEKNRTISRILEQCRCPTIRKWLMANN